MTREPTDIAERLLWCATHSDQMQAILAMEAGSKEIEWLRVEIERLKDYIAGLEDVLRRSGDEQLRARIVDLEEQLLRALGERALEPKP